MSSDAALNEEFTPKELASLPEFHHPRLSPDGSRVAFFYDGTGRAELYVQDLETGERTRLTDGEAPRSPRWHLAWDGSGERILFHRDNDGDEQNDIFACTLEGEVSRVVGVDGQAVIQDSSSDGRYVLYGSDEGEQMNLYRFDAESGEREQLTAYDRPVWAAQFSPDDERIAYVANESEDLENRDVYVMDADGSAKENLNVGDAGAEAFPADWHPDGDRLLLADNSEDLGRVGVYDFDAGEVEWLGDGEYEEAATAFTPDGSRVVVSRSRDAARVPVVYDLETGESEEFDLPEGVASVADGDPFVDDDELLVTHTTTDTRETLYRYDLETGGRETVIAAEYGDVDPEAFVDAEYVTYPSDDWLEIGAVLYDPRKRPGADPDATDVPAVVAVHGGPHGQSTRAFDLRAQFLVSKGYAVLQPNYRGSVGRGRAFKNLIHGDWGGMEQADVAAGGRWLAAREWIDEDRMAVYGGSYGGYSAYMQLVKYPTLWKTGIAWVGITDLPAMFEESMPHFKTMLRQQLGDPEADRELWEERSPVTHVENMRRPIFMVHGVNDPRCPVSQARIFRDALEDMGWEEGEDGDFEYRELGEEGHGSRDIDQKIRAFTLMGDYLDRRL